MLEYVSAAFILLGVLSPAWAAPFDGAAFVVERDSASQAWSWPKRVKKAQVDDFKYWSEWSAASYCPAQTNVTGGKVTCGTYGICPGLESVPTKVIQTWLDVGGDKGAIHASGATGFVGIDNSKKMVVVSMRGSVSVQNWVTDIKFALQDCPEFGNGSRCETGFYSFWQDSKPAALDGLKKALAEVPSYNIVVTGHSLGAAAAVYAAAELRTVYKDKDVWLYNYGQPRAGNIALSDYVTKQGKNFRVTHTSDIVPRLPWETVGKLVIDKDIYGHISPEYWITDGLGNNPEKYKVLEGMQNYDGNASKSWTKFNIVAHIQYYQTNMYGCTLSFLPMGVASVIGIGYHAGTKKRDPLDVSGYDVETTPEQLAEAGVQGAFVQEWRDSSRLGMTAI